MLDNMKETIKAARIVASWTDETREEILALADEFRAQASTVAPVKKRKYTKKAKPQAEAAETPKKKGGWPAGKSRKKAATAEEPVNGQAEEPVAVQEEEEAPVSQYS